MDRKSISDFNFGNNFSKFKEDFFNDTGVGKVSENIELYIEYSKARFLDLQTQTLVKIYEELNLLRQENK